MKGPELLSPAGTLKHMRYAFAYGADAVYAGQPRYSLRVRENEFDAKTLAAGIEEAHGQGKQFYVAANIAPHNSKVKTFLRDIEPVIEMGPDALIMSDPGLIMMVRDRWPDQTIHLSVQANVVNWAAVEFWRRQGVTRIILSRELSLEEIGEIREQCPDMELEVFVHGALCIAYSGRCLLSGYMNHRDPNQGTCTNACRWKYQAHEAVEDEAGNVIAASAAREWSPEAATEAPTLGEGETSSRIFLLQEGNDPSRLMPAYEDEHGTYIMNSKDLRAIHHVPRLTEMGVHSLKIEGRTKSFYYVARTAQAYRKAIDDAVAGRPFDMRLMDDLEKLAHRGYTEGFYRRHVHDEYQNYEKGHSTAGRQQFVGEAIEYDADAHALIVDVKNRFAKGDAIELMTPAGNREFRLSHLENLKGQSIDVAPGSGHTVKVFLPEDAPRSANFTLLMRNF